MQLASLGMQDTYITGQPQITFFKLVYRRHTNFAVESISQTFDGTVDFGKAPTVTFPRIGDLLGAVWLEITVPDLLAYDIAPTPAEGNSVDVTTQPSPALFVDSNGTYWQDRSGSPGSYTYGRMVALTDGRGGYYTTGTPGNAATYANPVKTWPYMAVTNPGNPGTRTFGVPTTDLRYVNGIGMALVRSVELSLGGTRLDKHYGEWWDVWSELTEPGEKQAALNDMVGKYADYDAVWRREQSRERTYYVPLRFCFNRFPGVYLPLVALSYHQVKMNFDFRRYLECVRAKVPVTALTAKAGATPLSIKSVKLYADYVFLDAKERIRMSQMEHEYLIQQLQFSGDEPVASPTDPDGTVNRKFALNFNHPVRELVWVYQAAGNYEVDAVDGNNVLSYEIPAANALASTEIFETVQLSLNGSDRFSVRPGSYFRKVQPYEHHTRVPSKSIYVYSFALGNSEDMQPNGTANFTRFDSAQMQFTLNPALPAGRVKFFAVGFNVLRVKAGMGAVAFAS